MQVTVTRVRSPAEIDAVRALVWEFFDFLTQRYPEMQADLDAYIADQNVAGELQAFGDYFLPPKGECFLAYRDDEPVGTVMLKPHGDQDGEMNRMFVREDARGLGLGRQLCEAAIGEARARGHRVLWLDALHRHVEALPLYESLGFERYTDPGAFGGSDPRFIHMKLTL